LIYAISDLHGCYDKFTKMLDKIAFGDNDTLYILGDIVDRGPDGIKILQYIMDKKNVIAIMGNHDYLALKMFKSIISSHIVSTEEFAYDYCVWMFDGGKPTYDAFINLSENEQKAIVRFIGGFATQKEIEAGGKKFLLSHSVLPKDKMLNGQTPNFNNYSACFPEYDKKYFEDKYIVTGHVPTGFIDENYRGKIWRKNNHIAIDCGAVFGNNLGCICLDSLEEFYVK